MKNIPMSILCAVVSFAFVFGMVSFYETTFDIKQWSDNSRFIASFGGGGVAAMCWFMPNSFSKK